MNLERDIEIMRAHRTTIKNRRNRRDGEQSSRPIHVALLRYPDKQFILKNGLSEAQGQSLSWCENFHFRRCFEGSKTREEDLERPTS